jgi:hypothetical protein
MALEQQRGDVQQQLAGLEQGIEQDRLSNVQKFAALSEKAKQELYDSRLQFQKDELGRVFLNERQLADYAKLKARSDAEFRKYEQQARQASAMEIQALETLNRRLEDSIKNAYVRKQEGLNALSERQLYELQRDTQARLQKAQNKAANKAAMWGAAGTIAGAAVGGMAGGPAGAMAGAQIGGGVGTAAGSQT